MAILTSPTSFQNALVPRQLMTQTQMGGNTTVSALGAHSGHPSFLHLVLLVFEAVLEVICVSLPGYIAARIGMFDAEAQKLVANLNVTLFTPCLIFTKLGSQLTAEKLTDLAIIPLIFIVQTIVSYLCSFLVSRCFRFKKRPSNFVAAMAVFGNSNSLPISLVMSLSQTLKGLHWDRIPNDNDDEVAARGILYLLIFQQLGQLVRWSWGYHVLLAPKERYVEHEAHGDSRIEQGQAEYTDNPQQTDPDEPLVRTRSSDDLRRYSDSPNDSRFPSGEQTPVTDRTYSYTKLPTPDEDGEHTPTTACHQQAECHPQHSDDDMLSFSNVQADRESWAGRGLIYQWQCCVRKSHRRATRYWERKTETAFRMLPTPIQKTFTTISRWAYRILHGLWDFMNPPLWAMLVSIVVASVPALQNLFFDEGTFVRNSVTRAINQNGQVAVPLILVVLGANLARNTLPKEAQEDLEDSKEERNLIIASLLARMFLPTVIMGPLLALVAKYATVSILDDPIFIIVCFLLTGAPSALQLAQICQINNVYVGAMSRLLFQSYVIWILPSTLVLVMCALEVLEWSTGSS